MQDTNPQINVSSRSHAQCNVHPTLLCALSFFDLRDFRSVESAKGESSCWSETPALGLPLCSFFRSFCRRCLHTGQPPIPAVRLSPSIVCPLLWLHFSHCHTWWSSPLFSYIMNSWTLVPQNSSISSLYYWHDCCFFFAFSLFVCALLPQILHSSATVCRWKSRSCLLGYMSITKLSKSGKVSGWMLQKSRNVLWR